MKYTTPKGYYYPWIENGVLCENHVLIAGATGSGKSVLLHEIMQTITELNTPNMAQFLLIDPKKTGLHRYAKMPHVIAYADELGDEVRALDHAINLMMARFEDIKRGVSMDGRPRIFVVIDELFDLMNEGGKPIQKRLEKLCALGREARVSCIFATQSPSRKTLPASIVLNMNCRIALHCETAIESRQIINQAGAELLPLYGVAIVKTPRKTWKQAIDMVNFDHIDAIIDHYRRYRAPLGMRLQKPRKARRGLSPKARGVFLDLARIALVILILAWCNSLPY